MKTPSSPRFIFIKWLPNRMDLSEENVGNVGNWVLVEVILGTIIFILFVVTPGHFVHQRIHEDEFNYIWVVLKDKDFEDLVTNVQMVSQTLMEQGFGTQLLAAVYRFKGENTVYWIYNFKLCSYYPFVPSVNQQRNTSLEFRLKSVMDRELPIEKDEAKWYPVWGMPI